jgi:phosphoribosyl 1,2-cyclic phosphate phosphodiesterase
MQVMFLGTGTSHGVPVIACDCRVCTSPDLRNHRMRCGLWVCEGSTSLLVDTPPELRLQAIRAGIRRLDAVLFTHSHADHIFGLDDLRRFSHLQDAELPCYGQEETLTDIRRAFSYVFNDTQSGGGKPRLSLHTMPPLLRVGDLTIRQVPVLHGDLPVLGFRFGEIAYVTDCSAISQEALLLLGDLKVLILGALRYRPHPTHFTIEQALQIIETLAPERAYLTHLTHDVDHEDASRSLPPNVHLAWDGLTLTI